MTEPLDPEIKRLRKLSAGDIADEVGALKAQLAALDERLDAYKAEGIRRELREAEGKLFRLTFTEPGQCQTIDGQLLRRVMGEAFVDHFSRVFATDWIMRCSARKAA
jgi:hypothetical protein